jgi:uncharacterized protein YcbK (DUF882 family)
MGQIALVAVLAAVLGTATTPSVQTRFFYSGDGVLELANAHFPERLHVRYRNADGIYDPDALAQIAHFFRSRSDGRSEAVSLRLIELIDFVQDRHPSIHWTLVSGYRSPELNTTLRSKGRRVADASLHTEGLAADLQPSGGNLRRMWLDLRALEVGGVGLYQKERFIHLDTGRPRFWEPATSGVEKHLSAGNARMFARTDFDRYADLRGAVITLHGVTELPLGIEEHAHLGDREITLSPLDGRWTSTDGCFVIDAPSSRYAFIATTSVAPPTERRPLRLATCAPRVGATPSEIMTNDIAAEITAQHSESRALR